jgi:NADPH oxidase
MSTKIPISVPIKKRGLGIAIQNWMVNDARAKIIFVMYTLAQLLYFAYSYYSLWTTSELTTFRGVLGHGLPIARGAGNVLNLNCAIILFTVCRNSISVLRATFLNKIVPVSDH